VPTFPSLEWALAFCEGLNRNPEYAEAAKAWQGDFLLKVTPDAQAPTGRGVYLDLAHGRCLKAEYVPDPSAVSAEFVYEGSRESWARLLRREIDPTKSLFDGTFRLRGNLAKAARFTRAAKTMFETAAEIPTD
jgi:putative sterol carrier protein